MTVGDVKTICPLAEVYELDPTKKYLFIVREADLRMAESLLHSRLMARGSAVIVSDDPQSLIVRTSE